MHSCRRSLAAVTDDGARRVSARRAGDRSKQLYNFDDDVLYEILVATGDDVTKGRATYAYQFSFEDQLQESQHDPAVVSRRIDSVGDVSQNLIQRYTVTKVDWRNGQTVRSRPRHRSTEQSGHHAAIQPQQRRRAAGA